MVTAQKKLSLTCKVLVLGKSGVGKSLILQQYTSPAQDLLILPKTTVGVDYKNGIEKIEDTEVQLQIWDTAGQEKYRMQKQPFQYLIQQINNPQQMLDIGQEKQNYNVERMLQKFLLEINVIQLMNCQIKIQFKNIKKTMKWSISKQVQKNRLILKKYLSSQLKKQQNKINLLLQLSILNKIQQQAKYKDKTQCPIVKKLNQRMIKAQKTKIIKTVAVDNKYKAIILIFIIILKETLKRYFLQNIQKINLYLTINNKYLFSIFSIYQNV